MTGTRWLRFHAFLVGAGWVVLALVGLVGAQAVPQVSDVFATFPSQLQGALAAYVFFLAIPLLWPVFLAIGFAEARLADRADRGDQLALGRARLLLAAQAALFCLPAVGLFILVIIAGQSGGEPGESWTSTHLRYAWLPFVAVAGLHLWLARRLDPAS